MAEAGKIFSLIPQVMQAVGAIGKDRRNTGQGYNFRGIDDVYNAMQGPMCVAGIFCVPSVLDIKVDERQSAKGSTLIYTTLTVSHKFYASDGSFVEAVTVGEAMDSGDKSSNKAMSAAMKYAMLEVFCIPTEDEKDTEYQTHEVQPRQQVSPRPKTLNEAKKELWQYVIDEYAKWNLADQGEILVGFHKIAASVLGGRETPSTVDECQKVKDAICKWDLSIMELKQAATVGV